MECVAAEQIVPGRSSPYVAVVQFLAKKKTFLIWTLAAAISSVFDQPVEKGSNTSGSHIRKAGSIFMQVNIIGAISTKTKSLAPSAVALTGTIKN